MNLTKDERLRLSEEIQFVVEKMRADSDPFNQIYFFSAVYGVIGRLLNTTWDPTLALVNQVTQTAYGAISTRLQSVADRRERGINLPIGLMEALVRATAELGEVILHERDGELLPILARLAELTYVTTGNGYYLYLKGNVKV